MPQQSAAASASYVSKSTLKRAMLATRRVPAAMPALLLLLLLYCCCDRRHECVSGLAGIRGTSRLSSSIPSYKVMHTALMLTVELAVV
jgi:hypothetical protein